MTRVSLFLSHKIHEAILNDKAVAEIYESRKV